MTITAEIFQSFLQCETEAHLKSAGVVGSDREYPDWQQRRLDAYKELCFQRLRSQCREGEYLQGTSFADLPPKSQHRLLLDCLTEGKQVQSRIHALERSRTTTPAKVAVFIPIRFVPDEKITIQDKLHLAFDALVLSETSGTMPVAGKIIHGTEQKSVKIQLVGMMKTVRATVVKITAQQASTSPPPLILNRHCAECEFQARCRKIAGEKDDLSLLSSMSETERKKHNSKGIFTVTQLSYTFRPRRKPKKFANKPEKYHHSLKALAIRENKIHVAGKPELKIIGTPVYLDVEGIPDRDFYYLIGLRVRTEDGYIQHSFWADDQSEEKTIWMAFLKALSSIDNPQIIHYGSYETTFLKRMKERYGGLAESATDVDKIAVSAVNVLSVIYAQVYFPTYSNGLKEIARYLGFQWSDEGASGLKSLIWREDWEGNRNSVSKQRLITYNAEDCEALQILTTAVIALMMPTETSDVIAGSVISADELQDRFPHQFKKNQFVLPDMEFINLCAYWYYQREKVYIRSSEYLKRCTVKARSKRPRTLLANKTITYANPPEICQRCGVDKFYRNETYVKTVHDLKFTKDGIRRWITKYVYHRYVCSKCRKSYLPVDRPWTRHKYGTELLAYVIYQMVELRLSQLMVTKGLKQLYGIDMAVNVLADQKSRVAHIHETTYKNILNSILKGKLIHADETKIAVAKKDTFVWVLANLEEVAYFHTDSREADTIHELLKEYKGVLVSDFYAAYDAIDCPQQKCLIHLMRDLNDSLLENPFDTELKNLAHEFTEILKNVVSTIDRYGLKTHYLKRHKIDVERFFRSLSMREFRSEVGEKYKQRFLKNRYKLFTFLDYDGVPWNNNNAEHAIKAFATLRKVIEDSCSKKSIQEHLILLSIFQTCKYKQIRFLDFLRSGETDIDEYIRKHRRGSRQGYISDQTSEV